MVTIRTDKGYEFARNEARKLIGSFAHISTIFFVTGEPASRDYVFKSGVGR